MANVYETVRNAGYSKNLIRRERQYGPNKPMKIRSPFLQWQTRLEISTTFWQIKRHFDGKLVDENPFGTIRASK